MPRFLFILSLHLLVCIAVLHAQQLPSQLPSNIDFSTVNVDNLSDAQLQATLQKAQQNGLGMDDIIQQAQAKGMPQDQLDKLRTRLSNLISGKNSNDNTNQGQQGQASFGRNYNFSKQSGKDSINAFRNNEDEEFRKRIFGADLFSNANLTFEPNLNIPTPGNYIIGPGDELIIDVYGYSEKNDRLKVTPEGFINVQNVGPIFVSGLSIDDAKLKITERLKSIYSGIANGRTHVQISLGNIRSIQIMVIGEIMRPGSYTLPSLATVANALYVSGGPDKNGSFRDIQLIRDGKPIVTFDLYDFLAHGSLDKNLLLKDQDIIKVNPYQTRIEIIGEIKHPAIFEAKKGEKLGDLLEYSGGYTSNAFKGFLRAVRINNQEKEILTIPKDSINTFSLDPGDVFYIDSILNRYTNRVMISGSVFHPGDFALDSGMTLKDLIFEADGITEEAFMSRGIIKRLKSDYSPEIISFSVANVLSDSLSIPLQREDSVVIYSKFKIREPYYIVVRGEVNHPDTIPFADNMKLGDVVLLAGGLKDAASLNQIEVGRRIRSQNYNPSDTVLAIIGRFSLQSDLRENPEAALFSLEPFDQITVRHAPGYHEQIVVKIEGEVLYPGPYIIDARNEKLSDLIRKAGGFIPDAFPEGALLLRRASIEGSDALFEKNKLDVFSNANRGDDSVEVRKIRDNMDSANMQLVGINLEKALQFPNSKFDLLLHKEDIVRVPKKLQTVGLFGEVFYPKQVRYDKRSRFKDFIDQAGGFTSIALRRGSYIVYPNGEVASTRKVLFFNHFPKVKPGSEIFVPAKRLRQRLATGELIGIITGIATLAAVLISVYK